MIWWRGKLSPEVRLLLERERVVEVLPAAARARSLARARAALAAGVASRPIPSKASPKASWAAAAVGLACLSTAAAAATAYELGVRARPSLPLTAPPSPDPAGSHPSEVAWPVSDLPEARRPPGRAPASTGRAIREERRLLERAHAAVAGEDFAAAMQLLAEHAHRFKTGRLAEEREALRVRVLVGFGQRDEARRAASAFEVRFPLSPLLSTIRQMPDSVP
jgi:predicted nuclease with RNAse H fold